MEVTEFASQVAAVGALLSGLAAIITAAISMRRLKKRLTDECDRRITELGRAFESGLKYEKRPPHHRG